MLEASDTGTENAVMGAVLAKGKTIIRNASYNYMVQDTCWALVSMGAKIEGIGSDTLAITGVKKLKGLKNYSIMADPIVAFSFISLAISTKSELTVKNVPFEFLELELALLEDMGQKIKVLKEYKSDNRRFLLRDLKIIPSLLKAPEDKIHAATNYGHGVNNDNFPIFSVLALQADGETLLCDWGYEGRQQHLYELKKMGAKVAILDVHRSLIFGDPKIRLRGNVINIPYLRAGIILLIAALTAIGKTQLNNVYQIRRGYAGIIEKLKALGADIH
jgi:UDP-N-acetylglucosamine 1-carboxyvinyltransferase